MSNVFISSIENELTTSDPIMEKYIAEKQKYAIIRELEETKDKKKEEKHEGFSKFLFGIKKSLKTVTGIQGRQDEKSTKNIEEACANIYQSATNVTESKKERLNRLIISFRKYSREALHKTVGKFLAFLKDMDQKNKQKKYEILDGIGLDVKTIEQMQIMEMSALTTLENLAIKSVSDAMSTATQNAIFSLLDGGSLVDVRTGIKDAILEAALKIVGGLLELPSNYSDHYSKQLTEAKKYQKKVEVAVAEMEKIWVVIDGIGKRIRELSLVTSELENRTMIQLKYMEPLTIDFDTEDIYYNKVFQKTGLLVKAMSELSKTPLFDKDGNISAESAQIITKTYTILNTELINRG